jgi:hypothetical protein
MLNLDKHLRKIMREELADVLRQAIIELDPNKHYILVVPTDIPDDQLRAAFAGFAGKQNLAVLSAENVRLIEL